MTPASREAFQVISDPSRRKILQLLSEDSRTINSLARHFEMSRPAVSNHINILSESGFISLQDIGRERHCELRQDWINHFDGFWAGKLRKLDQVLSEKSKIHRI